MTYTTAIRRKIGRDDWARLIGWAELLSALYIHRSLERSRVTRLICLACRSENVNALNAQRAAECLDCGGLVIEARHV